MIVRRGRVGVHGINTVNVAKPPGFANVNMADIAAAGAAAGGAGESKNVGEAGDDSNSNRLSTATFENGNGVDMEATLDADEEFNADTDGNKVLKLQSPSDDAIATMAMRQSPTGSGGITEATADQAMEPDNYDDIAKHNIIQVGGDDKVGRKLIYVYCNRLPPSKSYNQMRLLGFLKDTVAKYVESDYSLVVFMYGVTRQNRPSWKLLVQMYRDLERKYKKNLKALYIVHPSQLVKMLWGIFRHIVSVKFSRKVVYIHFLSELNNMLDTKKMEIPQLVKEHDDRMVAQHAAKSKAAQPAVTVQDGQPKQTSPTQQFGVSLDFLQEHDKEPIPKVVRETVEYLKRNGLRVEGLFRRCPNAITVKRVQEMYNNGDPVNFTDIGDVHVPALLLKAFFRELPEPIMTFDLYDDVLRVHDLQDNSDRAKACRILIQEKLPEKNRIIFTFLMKLLREVSLHSTENQMSDSNLAIVFGPNLVWSRDSTASLSAMAQINSFIATILFNYEEIFPADPVSTATGPAGGDVAKAGALETNGPSEMERTDGDGENQKELSSVEDKAAEA